jgi:hypothetical protein
MHALVTIMNSKSLVDATMTASSVRAAGPGIRGTRHSNLRQERRCCREYDSIQTLYTQKELKEKRIMFPLPRVHVALA